MSDSLDSRSKNLKDGDMYHLKKEHPEEEIFKLLRKKGVYPYDYVDSREEFNETCLPPKESFYERITDGE